jgi:hypothetical protein
LKLRHPLHLDIELLIDIVDLLMKGAEQAPALAGQDANRTVPGQPVLR